MENNKDLDHLRLLSIFHYVVGGLGCLFWLFPLVNVVMGVLYLKYPEIFDNDQNTAYFFGYFSIMVGAVLFLLGEIASILLIFSGNFLKKKVKYKYSFVAACISCLWIPFGTVLGIFTIMVLSRPSVKEIYGR